MSTFRVPWGTLTTDFKVREDHEIDDSPSIAESYRRSAQMKSNTAGACAAVRVFGARSALIGAWVRDPGPVRPAKRVGVDSETGRKVVSYRI